MQGPKKRKLWLILFAVLCCVQPIWAAEQVPFNGTVAGYVTSVTPQDGSHLLFEVTVSGIATHLGRFTGEAQVVQNVADGSYVGSFTWTADNGDTISGTFSGQLIPTGTPGVFENIQQSILTGGTGRFADATGGAEFLGQLDAGTLSFVYPFEGAISSVGSP